MPSHSRPYPCLARMSSTFVHSPYVRGSTTPRWPSVAVTPERTRKYSTAQMHRAATLYYLEDATQGDVAVQLGVSRATVSRLLAEARRLGIVRIDVVAPVDDDLTELAARVRVALGLDAVELSELPGEDAPGLALAPAVSTLLAGVGLRAGDALLVSSGRTVYEVAQAELPRLPGVQLAPMIGGQDEPEVWYASNEITRQVAAKVGGTPAFLYAPAVPGAELHALLLRDPSIRRVVELWRRARSAIMGVGAPPLARMSLPGFVPRDTLALRDAVGDVVSRFYDHDGRPVPFAGDERLMAVSYDVLRAVPACIGVAAGAEKVPGILAGARAGYFNQLATDPVTARALLAAAG